MHTDPIADLLTRIRNGLRAHHDSVEVPHSNVKEHILEVMKSKKFIKDFKVEKDGNLKTLKITLNTDMPNLTLKRKSKPGQRIYVKKDELKTIKSGLGISILSTSQGIMTNIEAMKANIGGELLCEIY